MAELIIFDCDGVLVDSEVIYLEVEMEALAGAGLAISRERYLRNFTGLPGKTWQAKVAGEIHEKTGTHVSEAFFARIRTNCADAFAARLAEVPGAGAALSGLDGPICVASSSHEEELHWKLRHTGLHELFSPHIFSTERVQNGKPAPDLFLHAAAMMEVPPQNAIVVEDSVNGVKAGKAAGMRVIGFTGAGHCVAGHDKMLQDHGADLIVTSFSHLPGMIDTLADVSG